MHAAKNSLLSMAVALTSVMTLTDCGRSPLMPQSGGKPYEVVLIGDRDSIVYHELDADVEGLPQSEPSFDVLMTDSATSIDLLARNVVRVSIDSLRYSRTHIRYDQDVNASPQLMVYIHTPSAKALRQELPPLGGRLRQLLTQAEMKRAQTFLNEKHNDEAERMIEKMFRVKMHIPANLTLSKRGERFLWFSNQSAEAQRCICLYEMNPYPAQDMSKRDSVMRCNIKGETDSMYMRTVANTATAYKQKRANGQEEYIVRGLWEMYGDAMGGPFVQRIIPTESQRTIVCEAFVFAPGMSKRNLIRQLEAVLMTLETDN